MNLQHLRYFLAVARNGNFSRAAAAAHVTQPTISSGVAELERNLGVRLFNRGSRHVELTMEGRTLVDYAVQMEDLLDEATERLQNRGALPGERFQFGATDAAVIYLLPNILSRYLRDYPDIQLSIQVAPSRPLVEGLLSNNSEFALISLPFDHPKIETIPIFDDPMPLVVGAGHPLARRRWLRPEDVAAQTLILFRADSVSRHIVDERFAELGLTPRAVMEMSSPEAMRKLVEAGVGLSFLPRSTVEDSLHSGTLQTIKVRGVDFARQTGLAWRRGRYFGAAIRHLVDSICAAYGKEAEWRDKVEADKKSATSKY